MRVELSARRIDVPNTCACCSAHADAELVVAARKSRGVRVVRTTTATWAFPYCSRCLAHVDAWRRLDKRFGIWASVIAAVLLLFVHPVVAALGLGLGLYANEQWFKRRRDAVLEHCSRDCVAPDSAVSFIGFHGTWFAFELRSSRFAAGFVAANAPKIVNATAEVRALLDR